MVKEKTIVADDRAVDEATWVLFQSIADAIRVFALSVPQHGYSYAQRHEVAFSIVNDVRRDFGYSKLGVVGFPGTPGEPGVQGSDHDIQVKHSPVGAFRGRVMRWCTAFAKNPDGEPFLSKEDVDRIRAKEESRGEEEG